MFTQKRTFRTRQSSRLLSYLHWILLVVLVYVVLMAWFESNTVANKLRAEEEKIKAETEIDLGELDSYGNWKD